MRARLGEQLEPRICTSIVAIRVCAKCETYLGAEVWDCAYDNGHRWLVTHGLCDRCLGRIEAECDQRDREIAT